MITFEWLPVNSISIASMSSTEVLTVEVGYMATIIPPSSFKDLSTVNAIFVIVIVECTEACTIGSCQGITCSACIATNIEAILGGSVADGEKSVSGKLLYSLKISEGHSELGAFCPRSEAVNVLQTQPVFTIRVTEAINIAGPIAVEVDRAIHSSLDDLPLTVHIAVHLEGSTTTWVNGVHSRGGAATVVHLLAVTRETFEALFTCEMRQYIVRSAVFLPLVMMSASKLTCLSMTASYCGKSYHQQKRAWEEHVDLLFHSVSRSEHNLGLAMCPSIAGLLL